MIVWCKTCRETELQFALAPSNPDQECLGCSMDSYRQRLIVGYDGPVKTEHQKLLDWYNGSSFHEPLTLADLTTPVSDTTISIIGQTFYVVDTYGPEGRKVEYWPKDAEVQWVPDYYWDRAVKPSPAERCLALVSKMNLDIVDLIDGPNPCIVLGGQDA